MSDGSAKVVQVEEAWEALEDELLHAPGAQGTVIGAEDAARALCLAVLAAGACDCDGSHESNCPWLEQGVRVRGVCAQIERLGRAQEG